MALSPAGLCESFGIGRRTASAGTAIPIFIVPRPDRKAKITYFKYTSLGTQHTVTAMRPLAKTTVKVAAAAGATSLVLTRDPGAYAANAAYDSRPVPSIADNIAQSGDYIAVRKPDGTWLFVTISGCTVGADLSATVTVSALPTGGIAAGAPVYFFGAAGDTDPNTGLALESFAPTVSATTPYDANGGAIVESLNMGDPIALVSNNLVAAGIIEYVSGIYGP